MLVTIMLNTQRSTVSKSSKLRNEAAIVSIFSKARGNSDLATGLQYFLRTYVAGSDIVASKKDRKTLKQACEVVRETLSVSVFGQDNVDVDADRLSESL